MKKNISLLITFSVLILAALAAFVIWGIPYFFQVELPAAVESAYGSETVRARVVAVLEEGEINLGENLQPYQVFRVELLEGPYQGLMMETDYGKRQIRTDDIALRAGDRILVTVGKRTDNVLTVYFVDYVRERSLLWLAGAFAVSILAISRWKGLRSLASLAFSLVVIIGYIIPHILSGEDPVRVSVIGSIILLAITLYLTYGWNLKTHAAVWSMTIVLLITGTLAWFFVLLTRVTGIGDENVMFLVQMLNASINLRGLFLGGMIIGALGVLDDLVTTQASAVFELHAANTSLGFWRIYRQAMHIGQDHVAATVNTLVLAYAGSSLPMLLLFSLARGDYGYLVNFSLVAEEIVRTLVGSLGLVAAVPITTFLAVSLALYGERLGALRPFLGPDNREPGHSH
ncbi:MAG: YibE/F family protein [Anaerolineales bacterium]|nr:YibE/F family protein [Anaerolineales bacterium]